MRLIDFIHFYQYFDNLDYKLSLKIDYLSNKIAAKLSDADLQELHDLRVKRQIVKIIERELSQFIIDL